MKKVIQIPKSTIDNIQVGLDYDEYLNSRLKRELSRGWRGVSIQHNSIDFMKKLETQDYATVSIAYASIVSKILQKTQLFDEWILRHEKIEFAWFPRYIKNQTAILPLYDFFKDHGIKRNFVGAIAANLEDWMPILPSIVLYPSLLKFQDLVLVHKKCNLIIKIGHHFNVDLISDEDGKIQEILENISCENTKLIWYRTPNG